MESQESSSKLSAVNASLGAFFFSPCSAATGWVRTRIGVVEDRIYVVFMKCCVA